MSKVRRVVVTGVAVITPIGSEIAEFWEHLLQGTSGISLISRFNPNGFKSKISGEVRNFDATLILGSKWTKRMDRFVQFSVACSRMAVEDAKLEISKIDPIRVGVSVGSAVAGLSLAEEQHDNFRAGGLKQIEPSLAIGVFSTAASSQISINLAINGPSVTIAAGCASGSVSIGYAFDLIRFGKVDMMIAGGADAPITPLVFGAYDRIDSLSSHNDEPSKAMRPFDRLRDGTVMSEGAGIVVLEELKHALKRNAKIYAEIAGSGISSDAYHMTRPSPSGKYVIEAAKQAFSQSSIRPREVNWISAHGSSTLYNDVTETKVIKEIFGDKAYNIPISAIKSMLGHMQGAGGAVEFISSALALKNQMIPPTINLENKDPLCDLDYVPNTSRPHRLTVAMQNSFGFGGNNSILLLKKF